MFPIPQLRVRLSFLTQQDDMVYKTYTIRQLEEGGIEVRLCLRRGGSIVFRPDSFDVVKEHAACVFDDVVKQVSTDNGIEMIDHHLDVGIIKHNGIQHDYSIYRPHCSTDVKTIMQTNYDIWKGMHHLFGESDH